MKSVFVVLLGILSFIGINEIVRYFDTIDRGSDTFSVEKAILTDPNFFLVLPDSIGVMKPIDIMKESAAVFLYFDPSCPHCKAQITEIITHEKDLLNIKFFFVTSYPMDDMNRIVREYSLRKYQNIFVGHDSKFRFEREFDVQAVPFMVVVGKDRKVKGTYVGEVSYKTFIKDINSN